MQSSWWISGWDTLADLASRARRQPAIRAVALVLALGIAAYTIYRRFQPQIAASCDPDFYSYYHATILLGRRQSPYASFASWIRQFAIPGLDDGPFSATACLSGILEYSYTPFFGLLVLPFTWLPYSAALFAWDAASLALLGGAVYAFLRAAGMRPGALHLLALTGIAMLTSPLRFELYAAEADILLLFLLCAALWAATAGRPVLAGLLLAVACASEPALLVVVPFLLWKRERTAALVTVLGSLPLAFGPFLWLGTPALRDLAIIWRYYLTDFAVAVSNNAPRGVLLRLLAPNPSAPPLVNAPWLVTPIWLLLALAVLGIIVPMIARRPLGSDSQSLLDVGLAVVALLLISPWTGSGQFTLLLVPFLAAYVCLGRIGWRRPEARWLVTGFVGALVLLFVWGDDVQYTLLEWAEHYPSIAALHVILAATYLYPLVAITGVVLYARRLAPGAGGQSDAIGPMAVRFTTRRSTR